MSATVTDLTYRRALKEVERATAALIAISKRTQERSRLLKEQTDARRARLDAAERDRSSGSAP